LEEDEKRQKGNVSLGTCLDYEEEDSKDYASFSMTSLKESAQ
jgi:hypothetical protein